MTQKSASTQAYLDKWFIEATMSDPAVLNEFIAKVTADNHPEDHAFVENPDLPGTCLECGWIEPGTETSDCECGRDLRDHVEAVPDMIASAMAEAVLTAMLMEAIGGRG